MDNPYRSRFLQENIVRVFRELLDFTSGCTRRYVPSLRSKNKDWCMFSRYWLCSLFISCCFFFFTAMPVFADEAKGGSIEIAPALVDVVLENPNEEKTIPLLLVNHSNQAVVLELFPIDFKQKDAYGGIGFLGQQAGSYSYSLSSFLEFETDRVELGPKERKVVTITAKNRIDLSPGGHYAAVVARMVQDQKQTVVAPGVSSLILLRKTGGERFNLSLKDLDWPKRVVAFSYKSHISLLFQNEGNVHLVPYGRVEIKDVFGRLLYKGVLNTPSSKVFPSSRRYILVNMKPLSWSFPISLNTIDITGQDSLKKTNYLYKGTFLYIHPLVLLLPLGILLFILIKRKKAKKGQKTGQAHKKEK